MLLLHSTTDSDESTGAGSDTCAGGGPRSEPAGYELVRGLYEKHRVAVQRYVTRLTGDSDLAEDVTQETLIRAWRHAGKLDPARVRAWLVLVARNIVVDRVRARRCRPTEVAPCAEGRDIEPASDDPSEGLVSRDYVVSLLATLNQAQREVLDLVYLQGRTVAEAAAVLGIPLGTAKSRIYHAMRALRPVVERDRAAHR